MRTHTFWIVYFRWRFHNYAFIAIPTRNQKNQIEPLFRWCPISNIQIRIIKILFQNLIKSSIDIYVINKYIIINNYMNYRILGYRYSWFKEYSHAFTQN